MKEQSYANHTKLVPLYHQVLTIMIAATFVGSLVNLYYSLGNHDRLYNAALITALSVAMALVFVFVRTFPLKAQDRAIRAEEK